MTEKGFIPSVAGKPTIETGGAHYQGGIEPIQFIESNAIPFHEANVIKYVFRWRRKDGLTDLQKAKWYIDRLIELETAARAESDAADRFDIKAAVEEMRR